MCGYGDYPAVAPALLPAQVYSPKDSKTLPHYKVVDHK